MSEESDPTPWRFKKGDPRAGRPLGRKNNATLEIRKLCASMLDKEWLESAKQRILAGEAPHLEKFFLEHRYGKPKETIEFQGDPIIAFQQLVVEMLTERTAIDGNGNGNGANGNGSDPA